MMPRNVKRLQLLPTERKTEGAELNTGRASKQDTIILTHLAAACDGLRHLSYTVAEEERQSSATDAEHGPSARDLWCGYRRGLQLIDAIIQARRTPVDSEESGALT